MQVLYYEKTERMIFLTKQSRRDDELFTSNLLNSWSSCSFDGGVSHGNLFAEIGLYAA